VGYYNVAEGQIIPDTEKGRPLAWSPWIYVKKLLCVSCSYTFKKILLENSYFHDFRKYL